jgi:DNA-binding SARP family transcriptional activator
VERLESGVHLPGKDAPLLEFRILGPLEVIEDDRPVALGGPRQRALLAILLLHRCEVVSSDRVVDELWGDRPPATAVKTLQVYVFHLRKALGNGALVTRGGGYVLAVAPEQVDEDRFGELVADARRRLADGDAKVARDLLGSALGLWRGEPLSDLAYEPFAQAYIARAQDERLAALEDRVEADLALGRHRAVVGELETLVQQHPGRERLLAQLMLALYRSGRQADALEGYRAGRRALQDELGIEPGPDLRALEQQILNQDPVLDAPPSRAAVAVHASRRRGLLAFGAATLLAAVVAAVAVGRGASPHRGIRSTAAPVVAQTSGPDGDTFVAGHGAWSGRAPIAYRYQWQRCDSAGGTCADIAFATGATYSLEAEDEVRRLRVLVTASNTYGSAVARSAPTALIRPAPPKSSSAPSIGGGASVGSPLAVLEGTWWGPGPLLFAYQWRRCDRHGTRCDPISGATHASYETVTADVGSTLRVDVTTMNDDGDATVTTAATGPIER